MNVRKILLQLILPYLKNNGYIPYLQGGDPMFVLKKDEFVLHFFFNFHSDGAVRVSSINLTHNAVEDIILNIDLPTFSSLEQYRKKEKYYLATVNHRRKIKPEKAPLKTPEEVEAFAHTYIEYLENEGQAFIDHYSYLPNVLKEMDRLEAENLYWKEILSGGPDYLFRGVIISKLCNDPNFNKKMLFVNSLLESSEDWAPYWAKLKEVLPSIQPKYNV